MTGGSILEQIEITLRNRSSHQLFTLYIDVYDNSLARKWLPALNHLIVNDYHLEKNFCFLGFLTHRDGAFICDRINEIIDCINNADIGYTINDHFELDSVIQSGPVGDDLPGLRIHHDRFNRLHRYFEDLQGSSGNLSPFYLAADDEVKWCIRQLNLLCHEFESWALSFRKQHYAADWRRPSQLMCWLNAPRFALEPEDLDLFGIDTIARPMGGVFVGVNKAVGKHHWEVFNDEGRDSRVGELVTSSLKTQTEAAGDFDIEWGQSTLHRPWMQSQLADFRHWLRVNGFDPEDPALTIGHPQIGQVDLTRSFGTQHHADIWQRLDQYLDVFAISTSTAKAQYAYHWSDHDYAQQQIKQYSRR